MSTKVRSVVCFLALIVLVAGSVSAVRRGRLVGRVVDPEDNPLQGVTVTATSPDIEGFSEVMITSKKGVFKIDFEEINVTYRYKFEKAGYQILQSEQYWSLEGKERYDFVMLPGQTPTGDGGAVTSSSLPAVAAYNEGLRAYEARDFDAAKAKFEEAIGHDPGLRPAWAALSVVLLNQEKYQEVLEAAEKAMALGSTDEVVLRSRWEAYRQLGDEAKAEAAREDLERFGQLTEEAKRIYNEAVQLGKAGDHENAFAKFEEASEIDPNLTVALFGLATTGLKIGRNAEADAAAQAILAEDPENAEALKIRYNAALGLGDQDMIIDALVGLAPIDATRARDGLLLLAYEAYDANDMAEAKRRFGKVLEVDPQHAKTHYVMALIYVNDEDNEAAIGHLESFLQLAPADPDAATAGDLLAYLKGGS